MRTTRIRDHWKSQDFKFVNSGMSEKFSLAPSVTGTSTGEEVFVTKKDYYRVWRSRKLFKKLHNLVSANGMFISAPPAVDMGWSVNFAKNHINMTKASQTRILGYSNPTPVAQRQYKLCDTVCSL